MQAKTLSLLMALLVVAAGCTATTPPDNKEEEVVEGIAWSFTDIDGTRHSADSTADSPVLLFFMASWCSSCRGLAPKVASVQADYQAQGLKTFSLSVGNADDAQDLRDWKEEYGQPWPHALDSQGVVARKFDVTSQSSLVVLDGESRIVAQWGYGGTSESSLRQAIDRAIAA